MKYKSHTIRETNTSRDVWRTCYGRPYRAIVSLYAIEGPAVSTQGMSPLWWPTTIADAKRMVSEGIDSE